MKVSDTELTVPVPGRCYCHTKTKRPERLTDGKEHPVKVIKVKKVKSDAKV